MCFAFRCLIKAATTRNGKKSKINTTRRTSSGEGIRCGFFFTRHFRAPAVQPRFRRPMTAGPGRIDKPFPLPHALPGGCVTCHALGSRAVCIFRIEIRRFHLLLKRTGVIAGALCRAQRTTCMSTKFQKPANGKAHRRTK